MLPMGVVETGLLAFGLSADSFAAAVGEGTSSPTSAVPAVAAARVGLCFGLFQAIMPIIGWSLGNVCSTLIQPIDHWIAFGLLALIGINMVRAARKAEEADQPQIRGASLLVLLGMGLATSIDAAVVGVGLGTVGMPIMTTALVIGIVTFGLSCAGVVAGRLAAGLLGRRAEVIGGMVLIALGTKILAEHILV